MDLRPILSAVSRFRPGLVPQKPSMSSVANVITCLYNYEATGVPTEIWYQSRTDCRKPLLLVDVESSVCKII